MTWEEEMKNHVVLVLFLLMAGLAFANPLEPLYTCRFWFDSAGDLNVRYNEQWSQAWQADLFDGVNHYVRQINPENPSTLTQVYPDAACTPQTGGLTIVNQTYPSFPETVQWGSGADSQITSLAPGQCGIQFYYAEDVENTIKMWGKDLISNPVNIWYPTETSTLRVYCHTQSGTGIAGVPVYLYTPNTIWQQTGADGWINHGVISSRLTIYIRDVQTNIIIFQHTLFAEPGITYTLDMVVPGSANDDAVVEASPGMFSIRPSVLRSCGDAMLNLKYEGNLSHAAKVELYDLKGRAVASRVMDAETNWNLPGLSSGVYFLRLTDRGKIMGTRKLIVLK